MQLGIQQIVDVLIASYNMVVLKQQKQNLWLIVSDWGYDSILE